METPDRLLKLARYGDVSARAVSVRLRAAREALGMTQADLAAECEVGQSAIANYEAGSRYPSRKVLLYFHRKRGFDFNFMLHGDVHGLSDAHKTWLLSTLGS